MSFYILADNCSDLPVSRNTTCKDFQILNLSFFLDNAPGDPTIRSADFYNKLRAGSMSRTSQINPPEFEDVFRRIIAQGYHEILYLAFSSGLSGTYHSSTVAAQNIMKENPNVRILTIDTLAAALGEGLIVDKAVEVRDQGKTIDEVAQWVEENKLKTAHWFTVDDLNFLKRGGRISASAAWFGSALKIKPVLHVDNNGKLIPMEKKIGRKKSLARIAEIVRETAVNPEDQTIYIAHGDCIDDVEETKEMIRKEAGTTKFFVNDLGPVIGSHSGPGTLAVFFFAKGR